MNLLQKIVGWTAIGNDSLRINTATDLGNSRWLLLHRADAVDRHPLLADGEVDRFIRQHNQIVIVHAPTNIKRTITSDGFPYDIHGDIAIGLSLKEAFDKLPDPVLDETVRKISDEESGVFEAAFNKIFNEWSGGIEISINCQKSPNNNDASIGDFLSIADRKYHKLTTDQVLQCILHGSYVQLRVDTPSMLYDEAIELKGHDIKELMLSAVGKLKFSEQQITNYRVAGDRIQVLYMFESPDNALEHWVMLELSDANDGDTYALAKKRWETEDHSVNFYFDIDDDDELDEHIESVMNQPLSIYDFGENYLDDINNPETKIYQISINIDQLHDYRVELIDNLTRKMIIDNLKYMRRCDEYSHTPVEDDFLELIENNMKAMAR